MRRLLAVLSFLAGAFIMLYVSNWLMLICGIIDCAHMLQGKIPATALGVALLSLRLLLWPFIWGVGGILFLWGAMLYMPDKKSEPTDAKDLNTVLPNSTAD